MSFFSSLINIGKKAFGFVTGDSIGGQIARTALTGFALSKLSGSITKGNAKLGNCKRYSFTFHINPVRATPIRIFASRP